MTDADKALLWDLLSQQVEESKVEIKAIDLNGFRSNQIFDAHDLKTYLLTEGEWEDWATHGVDIFQK